MINMNAKYSRLLNELKKRVPFEPEICIVLGSGLGDFAEKVETILSIPTSTLDDYPHATVEGHSGYLHFSEYAGKKLIVLQGRIHIYEGYSISECVLPVHISAKLGCKKLLLTNAAGGINPLFSPGSLMLASSFNGSVIGNKLADLSGIGSLEQRNLLLDYPSGELSEKIKNAALEEMIALREGLYWMTMGPSYETASEIKMYRKFGADAVGMSTVPEAYYAASLGLKVAAISCITNFATGLSRQALSHAEVIETADRVKHNFERLLKKSIELL
jgi:purine-nucleoside phosphorylase